MCLSVQVDSYNEVWYNLKMKNNPTLESSLADFIVLHEDFLPHDLCDKIMQEYYDENFMYDKHHGFGADVRNLHELNISDHELIDSSNSYVRRLLDRQIYENISKVRDCHCATNVSTDTGYSLRRMDVGNVYKQHTDQGPGTNMRISVSICLSDDYEGGELCFFDRALCFALKKGQALSFPSNYLYPHEVCEVTSGTRFAIVTWLS